ncbi:MAG: TonB-dependent receptor [Massilibacteroides sp.]|nr:TonB-dependent receptor [Massilibacteroides sp.]MDD4661253.1 TonB-dependent receptor [Massilibacteroides sp.]
MNLINLSKVLSRFLILVTFSFIPYLLTAQEKKISIQEKSISLEKAFEQIEKQTGYSIAYGQSKFDNKKKISLTLKDASLDETLTEVLRGTGLSYKINGYHIILIREKENTGKEQTHKSSPLTQTIRGTVTDAETSTPIEFATISLLSRPEIGTTADSLGRFALKNIPIGRYDIQISYLGYKASIYREILLTSSREVYLDIPLKEDAHMLEEVLVTPNVNKEQPLNPMALSGGRMLSVEEANRFAGALDDPARLVTSFAGVAGSFASNSMSIRGNAPQYTQWKLEGIEIPNPTHFADMVTLGGGTFTALSNQVMGNSDFFNGAFPSEYGNALSGVFDINLRNGNSQRYQNTFQIGLLGIDAASEGPISRKNNSSYIFNYRYSTTGLVTDADLRYQDLSFKLNFPTKKAGTFSIFGIGLIDNNKVEPLDKKEWETYGDREDVKTELFKGVGVVSHKYYFNSETYIKSTLAGTYSGISQDVKQINSLETKIPVVDITNETWDIVLNSYINKKFSSKHTNRTGITVTGLIYDLDYSVSPNFGMDVPMENIAKGRGESLALSAYSSSIFNINKYLSASAGINLQYFDLNKNLMVEPRIGMKWDFKPKQSLSLAYGLHSRRERLDYYFIEVPHKSGNFVNKDMDLSQAHHFVLSYDWSISPVLHLKVEPYFQSLFNIPVEANSSFSVLNLQDYYLDKALVNSGKGRNYGVDITLERYLSQGYYYMLTGSLFNSEYTGGDGVWRNTRLNRNYIFNALGGKEWIIGNDKNKMFNLNLRLTYQGGDRYTPVDIVASEAAHEIILDEANAFSKQFKPAITGDISVSYKINKKKVSHEFSLKVLNVGTYTGQHGYQYNEKTKQVEQLDVIGILPDISYKIHF